MCIILDTNGLPRISKGPSRSCSVGDPISPLGSREGVFAFDSNLDPFIKKTSVTHTVSATERDYEQVLAVVHLLSLVRVRLS